MTLTAAFASIASMTTQKKLVLQIRSRLALLDKTQRDLGDALGIGHAALSARMNGRREFTFSELEKMAEFFGISLRELLDFGTNKEDQR